MAIGCARICAEPAKGAKGGLAKPGGPGRTAVAPIHDPVPICHPNVWNHNKSKEYNARLIPAARPVLSPGPGGYVPLVQSTQSHKSPARHNPQQSRDPQQPQTCQRGSHKLQPRPARVVQKAKS